MSLCKILVAEFISPQKVYTFSSIVANIIPKSEKCIRSATKRYVANAMNNIIIEIKGKRTSRKNKKHSNC